MSRFVPLSVAGLLMGVAVPLFSSAVAQTDPALNEQVFASCQHRFAVIYPGQPKTRDFQYATRTGGTVPAREYLFREGADRFAVTVAVFPASSPQVDDSAVEHAAEQLRASVYMANRHLTITEAMAAEGDFAALQFEQSIALTDEKGNDLDAPNGADVRNFGCK